MSLKALTIIVNAAAVAGIVGYLLHEALRRPSTARRVRDLGRNLADVMDNLRADDTARGTEAANALDDALDRVDSAIRTLESEDPYPDEEDCSS